MPGEDFDCLVKDEENIEQSVSNGSVVFSDALTGRWSSMEDVSAAIEIRYANGKL
jgi:hypothetical protein